MPRRRPTRAMWTGHPNDWPRAPFTTAATTVFTRERDDEPVALIALPGGAEHPVYAPERERLGFRLR